MISIAHTCKQEEIALKMIRSRGFRGVWINQIYY